MTIKIGDIWLDKEGNKFKVVGYDSKDQYPMLVETPGGRKLKFTAKGSFMADNYPHPNDIMKMETNVIKEKTNQEFLEDLIKASSGRLLVEVFVLEAIQYYSEVVIKQLKDPEKRSLYSVISHDTWYEIAQEMKNKIDKRYTPKL